MGNYSNDLMDISYVSERSIEDEVIRESVGDIVTISVSYIMMFAYVTLSLGKFSLVSPIN